LSSFNLFKFPLRMKFAIILSVFLALAVTNTTATSCRFDDETAKIFRVGGRPMNCAEVVTLYPRFACFNRFISTYKCCHRCGLAKAQNLVTCEDEAECSTWSTRSCGDPKILNACPRKCRRCR